MLCIYFFVLYFIYRTYLYLFCIFVFEFYRFYRIYIEGIAKLHELVLLYMPIYNGPQG
jgi:hypothetical protein